MNKAILRLAPLAVAVLFCTSLYAHEEGDVIVRAGLTTVSPDASSSGVYVDTVGDVGMRIDVDDGSALGLNLVYMLNEKWGVELLAATPFSHDINLGRSNDNGLSLGNGHLAKTKHLPPTLSAVYYLGESNATFQPYAGIGLNYTVFFDDHFTGGRKTQTFSDLDLDDSVGIGLQLGFDYMLENDWLINASVRYIDIETEANFSVLDLDSSVDVAIDPWVYSIMLGRKF